MKVHLSRTTKFPSGELSKITELLQREAGPMEFVLTPRPILFETDFFAWDDLFSEIEKYRTSQNIPDQDFVVCVTDLKNDQNWFSACDPSGKNNVFVDGADWDYFVYAERKYPIAFEVVLNILQRKMFTNFNDLLSSPYLHDPAIGCISDMCSNKTEIGLKMRTADICNDCIQALDEVIGDRQLLEQTVTILESLRRGMIHSRVFMKPLSFEERLPFSVAITKRRMGMTTQPFRKFLMMIDHFDSVIRTAVIMLSALYSRSGFDSAAFFQNNKLLVRPSLGIWVKALANLSSHSVDPDLFSLPPDFSERLLQVISLEAESKIVRIRNEKRGHGYIECGDVGYEQELANLLPVLHDIEQMIAPLFERFHYYFVGKLDRIGKNFNIHHVDLSGSNPAFLETTSLVRFESIDEIPESMKCYLVTPDKKQWTSLDPYIKFGTCPECDHYRLLIQDGGVYIDPFIGHRVQLAT